MQAINLRRRADKRWSSVVVSGLACAMMGGCGSDDAPATADASSIADATTASVSSMTVVDSDGSHVVVFDEVTIAGAADGSEWSFGGSFGDFDTPSEVDLSVGMNTSGAAVLPGDHVCDDQSVVNVHLQFKFKGTFYFASIVGGSCTVTMPPIEPAGGMMEFTVTATSRTGGGSPGPEMTATIIGPRTISGTAQ